MTALRTLLVALALATPAAAHIFTTWLPLKAVGYNGPFGHDALFRYTDVATRHDRAWLATRDRGVAVLRLAPDGKPTVLSRYAPSPVPVFTSLAVLNDTGYFATLGQGIHVVDLQGAKPPRLRARLGAAHGGFERVTRLALHDQRLYALSPDASQIGVFDVRKPEKPRRLRSVETGETGELRDLFVAGRHLYVAGTRGPDGRGAVYVYDLEDLARRPRILATGPDTASASVTPDERFLVVSHDRRGGQVSIHDLAAPDPAKALERIGAADYEINTFGPSRVYVKDQVAYVAWHQGGVQVIDLDTIDITGRTQRVGVFGTAAGINPLAGAAGNVRAYPLVSDNRILLVDSRWGLFVVDATHVLPGAPEGAP